MTRITLTLNFFAIALAIIVPTDSIAQQEPQINNNRLEWEVNYRSPVRYVVTYNEIDEELDERRIWVLMDPSKFNLESIKKIIAFLKEKYPQPNDLDISIHTSLETIETPEEMEMYRDSSDSRFAKVRDRYRRAWFRRDSTGLETLLYTVRLTPYREKKIVVSRPFGM